MSINKFLITPEDLVTTKEARREGFLEYALRRNRESIPFIDKAKALKAYLQHHTKCCDDLLKLVDIQNSLLEAAGISVKAKSHLKESDKKEILARFIKDVLKPSGEKYIDEVILRYLLTLGDSLGGRMRNIVGSIACEKVTRFLVAQLEIHGRDYEIYSEKFKWVSQSNYSVEVAETAKALRWKLRNKKRSIIYNINVPQVKKNIDIVILNDLVEIPSSKSTREMLHCKEKYLAIGELKGGIDPAGADEHWKTASTALERVRQSFDGNLDLFFIGAAIEVHMANEIFEKCRNGQLANVANLTVDAQLAALCEWLIMK